VRLIFVNYSHPQVPHIAGTRLREFAGAMARRGHRVVLVSSPLTDGDVVPAPLELARIMDAHDWSRPLHVACAAKPTWYLEAARSGRMPVLVRRAISLWSLIVGDGPWHDWVAGSQLYWPLLADQFKPDLVWGNFGSVSDLVLAQALARRAGVPWCADVKDNMHQFLPAPTRPVLARRFADAAAITANAKFHAAKAGDVFGRRGTVLYSGFDERLLAVAHQAIPRDRYRIMLLGSIYSEDAFARYLGGLERFIAQLPQAQRASVELCYAGGEGERVRAGVARFAPSLRLDLLGYLSPDALRDAYARAAVQSYIWAGSGFHHKTVEMLVTNRPVVAFPDEFDESRAIARTMQAALYSPGTSAELANVLGMLHGQWLSGGFNQTALAPQSFTWDAGSEVLEQIFESVLRVRSIPALSAQPAVL
jgi:hypothetical protein